MNAKKKPSEFNFEKSLSELNTIVETMEKGDVPLEKSLQQFEQGIAIIRQCQKALTEAEQKVEILMQKHGNTTLETFEDHDD